MWFAVVLFIILSPGILITLPSLNLFSEQTSIMAVAIHALLFATCLEAIQLYSSKKLIEGFTDSKVVEGWTIFDGCGQKICNYEKPVCRENSDGARFCSEE
jgi:hypothetical protein